MGEKSILRRKLFAIRWKINIGLKEHAEATPIFWNRSPLNFICFFKVWDFLSCRYSENANFFSWRKKLNFPVNSVYCNILRLIWPLVVRNQTNVNFESN